MADARLDPLLRAVLADDPENAEAVRRLCLDALAERSRLAAGVLEDADSAAVHAAVRARARMALAPRARTPSSALRWLPRVAALLLFGFLLARATGSRTGSPGWEAAPPRTAGPAGGAVAVGPDKTPRTPRAPGRPDRLIRVTTRAMNPPKPLAASRFEAVSSRRLARVRFPHRTAPRIAGRRVARALPRGRVHGGAERIDDQRLLALFPGRARALVETPRGVQLLFLDEIRRARPGLRGPDRR